MALATQQKTLGAFYTSEPVARYLVEWAVRHGADTVLDPSCGCGVFVSAAENALRRLGSRRPEVWGIDVDQNALRATRQAAPLATLCHRNFFTVKPGDMPSFSVVVGNPPFIRYQTFNGSQRSEALERAREAGVDLPRLSSSWAPFVVHAAGFLRRGGRLGMVAPAELAHAKYATGVLRLLTRKFRRITVMMFRRKLFPELSEDTLLLLCKDYGHTCEWFGVAPVESIDELRESDTISIPADVDAIRSGRVRLTRYLLSPKALHLYESMSRREGVTKLGDAADVGIGYVTGCNEYFHLSLAEARKWRISPPFRKKALLSLGEYGGVAFRLTDWRKIKEAGKKAFLFTPPASGACGNSQNIRPYIQHGERLGFSRHYKCRVRDPWYVVPHVRIADAFLSYMSGGGPKLVTNIARVVAPNTLHIVRFFPPNHPRQWVAGWYTSLTRLSCELEGHPLGGGMLKLEPSEAERVLVALPRTVDVAALYKQTDKLLRDFAPSAAMDLLDLTVLRRRFGLSGAECITLREAAKQLEAWRMHR